jgi:ABC-type bacteriocin/lantibiotic exporter with double-glycine peptidase domain
VLIGTSGVAVAMFGRFLARPASDIPVRCGLAALSFVVMLHPSQTVAMLVAAVVVPFTLIGIWRHRILATPEIAQPSEAVAAPAEDVAALLAEAKREL